MVKISNRIDNIGLFQEKSNQEGSGYTFLTSSWNFEICHVALGNSRENRLSPLEILQNCVTPLGNFKVKNQEPSKIYDSFYTPLEISLLF